MLKWIILDKTYTDGWLYAFDDKNEALKNAKYRWEAMSDHDKKNRVAFGVYIANVEMYAPNVYCYAENSDGTIDSDLYYTLKEYK